MLVIVHLFGYHTQVMLFPKLAISNGVIKRLSVDLLCLLNSDNHLLASICNVGVIND